MRAFTALLLLLISRTAWPCAPAPPEDRFVSIEAEQALIIWDEGAHREHFIRRAAFTSDADDFGFLVPTPSRPELREVPAAVFEALAEATKPEVKTVILPGSLLLRSAPASLDGTSRTRGVKVLEQRTVAGYDATVLLADDPAGLSDWLKAHGYPMRSALEQWLVPYVENHWVITAFKISKSGAGRDIASPLVDMAFSTERPMYPYREPVEKTGSAARLLRVYFVGPWKALATIGTGATSFPGKTYWASPFEQLKVTLPAPATAQAWLTVFDDPSSPRPAVDELWFSPAPDSDEVAPPPRLEVVSIPCELGCPLVFLAGLIALVIRRRRRRSSSAQPKP